MNRLTTHYLGHALPHPLVLGACPLARDLDGLRRAEDGGAAAVVLHSLFEEQITQETELDQQLALQEHAFAEATHFHPLRGEFALGPDAYLEHVRRAKAALAIPVFASLNGVTNRGWLDYARLIQEAGADGLELNVYRVTTDADRTAAEVESETLDMVRSIKAVARLPVAVKLSPFYSALPNFVRGLARAGADAVVIFNRFYQPDIDVETLEVDAHLELSNSSELLLRLRWLSILSACIDIPLSASGGVHSALDALKCVMTGASSVQLVSEILARGPKRFSEIRTHMQEWLVAHDYDSLAQMQKSMNLSRCPRPDAYERANYMQLLNRWRAPVETARSGRWRQ